MLQPLKLKDNHHTESKNKTNIGLKININQSLKTPQKSLKELFMSGTKNNLIQKIQNKLMDSSKIKVSDRTIFCLTSYINSYQALYHLIHYNLLHVTRYVEKFKQKEVQCQVEGQLLGKGQICGGGGGGKLRSIKRNANLSLVDGNGIRTGNNFVRTVSESYRFKCLKQFFTIERYSEDNIANTVTERILYKYNRGELKVVDLNTCTSVKRVSILNHSHRRQASQNVAVNENYDSQYDRGRSKKQNLNLKMNLNSKALLNLNLNTIGNNRFDQTEPNTKRSHKKQRTQQVNHRLRIDAIKEGESTKRDLNLLKPLKVGSLEARKQKSSKSGGLGGVSSPAPVTFKSMKFQSRRNGFQDLNKINLELQVLKESVKNCQIPGEEIMKMASDLKRSLETILAKIKIRSLADEKRQGHCRETRQSQSRVKRIR